MPRLTPDKILDWADEHHARTGDWTDQYSGPIAGTTGERWAAVNAALGVGGRGLPGNSSLAQLLSERRGVRNHLTLPRLSVAHVLAWIDDHNERTGRWPRRDTGPVLAAPNETWNGIDSALKRGHRGLPAIGSLAHLLAHSRGVCHPTHASRLTVELVLAWADRHRAATAHWPTAQSGPVEGVPGDTWAIVDNALRGGRRGLPAGSSLARLLAQHRGVPNRAAAPPLSVGQVLA